MFEFNFFSKYPYIPSVNYMYDPGIFYDKAKRPRPYIYKRTEVRDFQEEVKNQISSKWSNSYNTPYASDIHYINSLYIFGLPKSSWEISDTSNMIKATEDAVFSAIKEYGFDDKMVIAPVAIKVLYPYFAFFTKQIFVTDFTTPFTNILNQTINPINEFFIHRSLEKLEK